MTLTPVSLSTKAPLIMNELASVICDKIATGNFIRCSDYRNVIYFLCTSLSACSNVKCTCINCRKSTSNGALMEFHEKLDQLEVEMYLLRENKMLRGENVMRQMKSK